jgi:hypothetical protein
MMSCPLSKEFCLYPASISSDSILVTLILRRCFDLLLQGPTTSSEKAESLADLLKRTIREGAPLFNNGDAKGCYELYLEVAQYACEQEKLAQSTVGQLLEQATEEAMPLGEQGDYGEAAWVLRNCFDHILAEGLSLSSTSSLQIQTDAMMSEHRMSLCRALLRADAIKFDGDEKTSSDDGGYWQDEKTKNTSDFEIGSSLADVAYIVRASIQPTTHKRFTGKSYKNTFQGSQVVEVLTGLGIAKNRKMAVSKATTLMAGSFLIPVSHESETTFHDGTHLYRFSNREELQSALGKLLEDAPSSTNEHPEGTLEAQLVIALQNSLDIPVSDQQPDSTDGPKTSSAISASYLQPRRQSFMSPEQVRGFTLAQLAAKTEKAVEIKDRTYRLKKYEKCFVGSEAVPAIVEADIAESKEEAIHLMKDLNSVGLLHHVLHDHGFEDKYLFYRFTSPSDLRRALEAIAILPGGGPSAPQDLVRRAALVNRYKQYADLEVAAILNSFFGCESEQGWDLIDLQNWRNNMKRWGFGRREDQDDEMVDKLSPLALNVDPETWYDNLSDEEKENWESPWGILAQVAIFDQVRQALYHASEAGPRPRQFYGIF